MTSLSSFTAGGDNNSEPAFDFSAVETVPVDIAGGGDSIDQRHLDGQRGSGVTV